MSKKTGTYKQGAQKNEAQKVVSTQNLDINKLTFEDLDPENEFCPTQMIGWVRYEGDTLNLRTPEFEISQYGVSSDGADTPWPKKEEERMTLKFPLDAQPGCVELKSTFGKIDKKMGDKASLFDPEVLQMMEEGTGFPYTLRPLVRDPKKETPMQRKEAEKKWAAQKKDFSKRKDKCQFWKAKIDVDFKTKKIKTILWMKDPDWVPKFEGDKEVPQKIIPNNADHLFELVPYGSKVSVVVAFSKWYADKAEKEGKLVYGVGLKIKQMLVTPRKKSDMGSKAIPEFAFEDEPEELEEDATTVTPVVAPVVAPVVQPTTETTDDGEGDGEDGDDDDDDGDDDDDEPEPEPEPPKKVSQTKTPVKTPVKSEPVKPQTKPVVKGKK